MTIETVSPAGAESLAALFDQLVEAVAQRVQAQLASKVMEGASAAIEGLKEDLDSRISAGIEDWAYNYLNDRLDTWATFHLDIEGDIDRYVKKDLDLTDLITETVKDLTFEITVS